MDEKAFTAFDLLEAYRKGMFPMSDGVEELEVYLVRPQMRGIIELDDFHVPASLRKFIRKNPFKITINQDFSGVIKGCAALNEAQGREESWINPQIISWFEALHGAGYAHSVECWGQDGSLVGGLYGLAIGGVFFGESMFSRQSGASKVALVYLVKRLRERGFGLLDCQFVNPHLLQFGCKSISADEYQSRLDSLVSLSVSFVD